MNKGHDKGHKRRMSDREVMKLALEALNRSDYLGWQLNIPIIKALRERLAQPEQEPVAWKHDCAALLTNDVELWIDRCPHCGKPRTAPPKREWQGLTDEEIFDVIRSLCIDNETAEMLINISMDEYRAIEAKLKEKNT